MNFNGLRLNSCRTVSCLWIKHHLLFVYENNFRRFPFFFFLFFFPPLKICMQKCWVDNMFRERLSHGESYLSEFTVQKSGKKTDLVRRVWRYQRGNQNPYIDEEQTKQWPKEKVQKDKQRSTKHTYKTKDRVTQIPLKTGGELRCSGRVGSSCSIWNLRTHLNGKNLFR